MKERQTRLQAWALDRQIDEMTVPRFQVQERKKLLHFQHLKDISRAFIETDKSENYLERVQVARVLGVPERAIQH